MVRIIFFLSLSMISKGLFAQGAIPSSLALPSSNNTFLGKSVGGNSTVGVDLYTGRAEITVPICNLSSKVMSIPVSLNYVDGGGVKLQEYASQVGLGWQLNAGGCISRVVRGFPDEMPNGYLGTGALPAGAIGTGLQWGKVVANYLNASKLQPTSSQWTAITGLSLTNPLFYALPTADGEPDIFYVKTPFFSFSFIFDETGTPVFSNSNGYKIIPTNFLNTTLYANSSFEVIDPSGNQFYFGNAFNSTEQSTDSLYNVPTTFISSWYLDKIITYNSQDVINLTYTTNPNLNINDTTYNYSWSEIDDILHNLTNTTLSTGRNIVIQPKYISTIASSLGELDFNYIFNTRSDDHNIPYLSSIVAKAYSPQTSLNSTTLQTYNFNYSYFGLPSTDPNILRLELTGITLTGNTTNTSSPLNIATFTYNTTVNLPNRTWLAFDYWGYCNSSTAATSVYAYAPNPNTTMTPADILTAVSGITGSTWNIFYEQNFWGATTIGGVRVNEISQTQGSVTLSKTYKYIYQNNNQSAEIISNAYTQIGWLINGVNLFLSGSPFTLNDINGNFVGYSSVKETEQNGGYTFYSFSNFNDGADPDGLTNSDVFNVTSSQTGASFQFISPSESLSYKRGLLTNKSVYNANGNLISQTSYNYLPQNTSLSTTPLTYKGYGFQTIPINATINGGGGAYVLSIIFSTPIENYRLTQAVQNDYDQVTPSNLVTTTTNYTYEQQPTDLINNYRLINNISIIDSKNLTRTQTIYHSEDVINSSAIPMVTASEKQAIQAMVNSNNTDAVIHTIDNNNSTMTLTHNSYVLPLYGLNNNIYLGNTATYTSDPANTTNTLVKQQFYNFDAATSNLISSNATANKSTAIAYGYNSSYPIAKTVNAGSTISYAQQPLSQTGAINVPPNTFAPLTTTFTTYYSGTITIAMPQGSYLATSVTCYFSFTLSGPSNGSGNLCNSSVSGYTCTPPNTVSFSNMPAGTYTLTVTALTNTAASIVPVNFTYTGEQFVSSPTNEYFFEGFEEKTGATSGFSHTGNMYWNTSYTVPYTPPNSRSYILQYWSFSGVTWNFKQVYPYTTGTILAGPVDDIRIFPSDALMTTYTYNPLVGKTSETDPSGRSTIYQYDGLNRLQTIRDQDNNILKQYDYEYQQLAAPVTNVVESGSFQRSCSSGYIGSFVTYTVPAGKYSSYISQQDANQQAINDVNTNGPAFANNPANGGTCMVAETVTYTDSRTFQYSVRFTNNSTGIMYNYTSNANSSGTFGQVPSGVYTVYICPIGNYTANNNYTVFGSSQSNVVCATFNNVSVTANGSINFY